MKSGKNFLFGKNTQLDIWLISSTILLVAIGLLAIYDSSVVTAFRDFGDKLYYFKNQLVWVSLGFLGLIFFSLFDYHRLIKFAPAILAGSIFLLLIVLVPFIGTEVSGARRWININAFTFQPSEIAKLAIIFYSASIMTKFNSFRISLVDSLIVYFLPILATTFLVIIQPDLGTALIFLATATLIYFVRNAPIWHFLLTIPLLIFGAILAIITQPYRIERIKAFIDPAYDPSGASYQINQIILALSSGGIFGVGLGGSKSKFEFIPEVHNDAIFAVVVEEIGFVGGLILIAIFLFLITRAIKIAREAADYSGKILAIGVVAFIAIQTLLNLSSIVALVPLTGIPLPFISYGGSSMFVTLVSIGILINIKKQS